MKEFAKIYYKGLALLLLTLGFYSPWFLCNIQTYLMGKAYYGDQSFAFDGDGKDLFGAYVVFLLLLIPTLYLSGVWYYARQSRYLAGKTSLGQARFRSTLRSRSLLLVGILNTLQTLFTLGIGYPWAKIRSINLHCDVLTLENFAGFGAVNQRMMGATATGESLGSLLEADSDIAGGLGL